MWGKRQQDNIYDKVLFYVSPFFLKDWFCTSAPKSKIFSLSEPQEVS